VLKQSLSISCIQRMLPANQGEEAARALYRQYGAAAGRSSLKQYVLTSDTEFERCFGFAADKKRKLYNGMLRCDLYMYFKDAAARRALSDGKNTPPYKSKGFVNDTKNGVNRRNRKK